MRTVDFDTGRSDSTGVHPQTWVNGNGNSYIYFGSGQFDGQAPATTSTALCVNHPYP